MNVANYVKCQYCKYIKTINHIQLNSYVWQGWESEGCESFTRMVEGFKEFEMIHLNQNGDIKEVSIVYIGEL